MSKGTRARCVELRCCLYIEMGPKKGATNAAQNGQGGPEIMKRRRSVFVDDGAAGVDRQRARLR